MGLLELDIYTTPLSTDPEYQPLPWSDFFHHEQDIATSRGVFHVYATCPIDQLPVLAARKPVVFCVHGAGLTALSFAALARSLRAHDLHTVAYDQRGHGLTRSPHPSDLSLDTLVEDAQYILRRLIPSGLAVVLGHSMGGPVAVRAATPFASTVRMSRADARSGKLAAGIAHPPSEALLQHDASHTPPNRTPRASSDAVAGTASDDEMNDPSGGDPPASAPAPSTPTGQQQAMPSSPASGTGDSTHQLMSVTNGDAMASGTSVGTNRSSPRGAGPRVIAVGVVDVAEQHALAALPAMADVLATRPAAFGTAGDAIAWAVTRGGYHNLTSCRVSIPAALRWVPRNVSLSGSVTGSQGGGVSSSVSSRSVSPASPAASPQGVDGSVFSRARRTISGGGSSGRLIGGARGSLPSNTASDDDEAGRGVAGSRTSTGGGGGLDSVLRRQDSGHLASALLRRGRERERAGASERPLSGALTPPLSDRFSRGSLSLVGRRGAGTSDDDSASRSPAVASGGEASPLPHTTDRQGDSGSTSQDGQLSGSPVGDPEFLRDSRRGVGSASGDGGGLLSGVEARLCSGTMPSVNRDAEADAEADEQCTQAVGDQTADGLCISAVPPAHASAPITKASRAEVESESGEQGGAYDVGGDGAALDFDDAAAAAPPTARISGAPDGAAASFAAPPPRAPLAHPPRLPPMAVSVTAATLSGVRRGSGPPPLASTAVRRTMGGGLGTGTGPARSSSPSSDGYFVWRVADLLASERYWRGWFEGSTKAFLEVDAARMLVVSGADSMDTELAIAQMQGKFQFVCVPGTGHHVHEDKPDVVADAIARLVQRLSAIMK